MTKNRRKQQTTLTGALIGAVVAVICCAIGAVLVTYGVLNELLSQQGNGIAVFGTIMISTIVGGLRTVSVVGDNRVVSGALSGVILLALILSAGLLLDGPFVGALSITASVAVGTMIVCVLCMKKQKKLRRPKSTSR
jgi:hypothetical protein